jgi:hypothetical protein
VARQSPNSKLFTLPRVLLALALAWVAAYYFPLSKLIHPADGRSSPFTARKGAQPNPAFPFGHPYFPYSVIPGGAYTRAELEKALQADSVAAAHYSDFNVAKAHVITLDSDRLSYVSFRKGDKVYWTSHQIRLKKGETLLTDGVHFARTRCGNRLSDRPSDPVVTDVEPAEKVFNAPAMVLPPAPNVVPQMDEAPGLPFEIASTRITGLPESLANLADPILPDAPTVSSYTPTPNEHEKPPIFATDGAIAMTGLPFSYPSETPPVSGVPEPGTAALGGLALIAVALIGRRMQNQRKTKT